MHVSCFSLPWIGVGMDRDEAEEFPGVARVDDVPHRIRALPILWLATLSLRLDNKIESNSYDRMHALNLVQYRDISQIDRVGKIVEELNAILF
ncbi:uncharacterized protein RCO7_14366 [Rhynchosporium graminicola]|uniref:Uncharacterized protein n=1 Tax=Rhynchosporium graminicola TaxID=2792576 RepID=A0A1E1KBK1_9HELO|nr:uncharacterized protein RCO7_14366 [Rhynchosporium commune]